MTGARLCLALTLALGGCGGSGASEDAGSDAATFPDAGRDASPSDTGPAMDGATMDATTMDATTMDATTMDATTMDGAAPDAGPEPFLPPGDPGAGDVRFDISSARGVHAISPWIYGDNQVDVGNTHGVTATRLGGNRWTAYNWETNASNAGSDYLYQNDTYLGGGAEPGGAVRQRVEQAHAAGLATLVTVPIAGYVAADTSGPTDSGGADLATRFLPSQPAKGAAFAASPNLSDGVVYQDEFVDWARRTLLPTGTVLWSLDNEPDLWSSTHSEIHPAAVTYAELADRSVRYATAIKAVVPVGLVLGPVNYGWAGMVNLQGAPDAMGRDFIASWLDAMHAAETTAGHRLIDALDLHWYSEATGGGARITDEGTGAAETAARVQAPRSLWDPDYVESSWITDCCGLGAIRLIPRMKETIAAHYPGTRLSLSEYSYGGSGDISGGVAEADALGVFGREDLLFATWWQMASERQFVDAAFEMYRDFDGAGATFGDTSIEATSSDVPTASVYASVDAGSPGRMVLVAINRATTAKHAAIAIEYTRAFTHARVFRLTSATAHPVADTDVTLAETNAFGLDLPPRSVTTIELLP